VDCRVLNSELLCEHKGGGNLYLYKEGEGDFLSGRSGGRIMEKREVQGVAMQGNDQALYEKEEDVIYTLDEEKGGIQAPSLSLLLWAFGIRLRSPKKNSTSARGRG